MTLESRIQALEDHCNHSLANAKLIATDGITRSELAADALSRDYLGSEEDDESLSGQLEQATEEILRLRDIIDMKDASIREIARLIQAGL
jgi:hypothetical protein